MSLLLIIDDSPESVAERNDFTAYLKKLEPKLLHSRSETIASVFVATIATQNIFGKATYIQSWLENTVSACASCEENEFLATLEDAQDKLLNALSTIDINL